MPSSKPLESKRLASAVGANVIAWAASAAASLAYVAVSSRIFTPATIGAYSSAMLAEGLLYLILGSGLSIGIHRKADLTSADEETYLGRSVIVGVIAAALMVALAKPWAALWQSPQTEDFAIWWAAVALFHPTSLVLLGILRRRDDHQRAALTVLVAGVGSSAIGVVPVIITHDPMTLVVSNILVPVIMIITASLLGCAIVPRFSGRLQGSRFVNLSTALNATNYVAYNAMAWSVSRFVSVAGLGVYSRAWLMADLPAQGLSGAAASVMFPGWSASERKEGETTLTATLTVVPAGIALVLALISALATPLVAIFLGAQWTETVVLLGVLPICLASLAPQWLLSSRLQAGGSFTSLAKSRAVGLAVAFVFAVVVALTSSLVAAALGAGLVHAFAHAFDLRSASSNGAISLRKVLRAYAQIPLACGLLWLIGLLQAAELWRPENLAGYLMLGAGVTLGGAIGIGVLARGEAGRTMTDQGLTIGGLVGSIRNKRQRTG